MVKLLFVKLHIIFSLIVVVIVFIVSEQLCADVNNKDPNDFNPAQTKNKPMIIWFHNAPVHKPATLEKALSSGIITHVWILFLNPQDAPLPKLNKARQAIKVCKKHNVEVIWARTLWPSYEVKNFRRHDMSDPNYYKSFIDTIRAEARILGADYTAVDTEPYALFPFKEIKMYPLRQEEFDVIKVAVDEAVAEKGQLDFVAPAGGALANHIYNPLSLLGRLRVAEHTYFDIPRKIKDKKRPYDVFGAYINVTKQNPQYPKAPFFTPEEILERQDLWGHKKGLYISANHKDMEKVAEMLSKIKYIKPKASGEKPSK
jgi:hypothetical protein